MALISAVASRMVRRLPREYICSINSVRYSHDDPPYIRIDHTPGREQIGYGIDSEKIYYDATDYPVPAVRYKRETPEILALREKEKGDWKKLSIDEKKELYRASFRLTFSEILAPTGRWKSYIGWTCFFWACGLWLAIIFFKAKNRDRMRPSLSLEARQAQLQRLIALKANPITGLASKWDYEKDDWKK